MIRAKYVRSFVVPATITSYSRLRLLYNGKIKVDLQEETSELRSNDSRYGARVRTAVSFRML